MKKNYLLLSLLLMAFTSCFEDEGNYDYKEVNDITIEGVRKYYLVYSYIGEKLEIPTTIQTGYTDLEYAWYIWDATTSNSTSGEKEKKEMTLIGTEKDLAYEVNLPPNNYKVMLEAKSKSTGYALSVITDVEISTTFLRGFYILKETMDGKSELDFHHQDGEPLLENVLTSTGQKPMDGKPLSLGICYSHGYIDPITNKVDKCNTIAITTKNKEIAFFSTKDMVKLHDNTNVVYGGLESGETPYRAFTFPFANCFLSSRGATVSYPSDVMDSSGTFGTQTGTGGSVYATPVDAESTMMYWNQEDQCVDYVMGMWMGHDARGDYKNGDFPTNGMECLMMGASVSTTPAYSYFLLKDRNGKQYLYESDINKMQTVDRIELDPNSKLANATCYAVNMWTAGYLYYVYENQLYAYSLPTRNESNSPLPLRGMGSGEQITYLSYQWMDCFKDTDIGTNFTHLVVGTQKGNTYKVYMYNIVAGEPRDLVRTIEGEGKLHSIKYVTPQFYANFNDVGLLDNASI